MLRAFDLPKPSRSRAQAVIDRVFADLTLADRTRLCTVARTGFSDADVAGIILGLDLWRDELTDWRNRFEPADSRPGLWDFTFGVSASWNTAPWRALPTDTRIFRAYVGSLALDVPATSFVRAAATKAEVQTHLARLSEAGLATSGNGPLLRAIAAPEQLRVDLVLVEIFAHWITMLANADRIVRDRSVHELDVWGYAGACDTCKKHWGFSPVELWNLPPFHPACRCFAQPRHVA